MADMFDDLAKALGHLVLAFNDLEVALGGALMYLLKQDEEVGAAFTAHLGVATKIRLLQDLDLKIEDENTRREFREMVKRAAEINTERNRYIHSEYWPAPATEQLTVMLHRSSLIGRSFLSEVERPSILRTGLPVAPSLSYRLATRLSAHAPPQSGPERSDFVLLQATSASGRD